MTHAEMDELYELWLLGALEPEQAAAIDEHVNTNCAYCLEHLRDANVLTSAMSGMAEAAEPAARLRQRVIASVKPETRRRGWLFAVAGLSAACVALLALALWGANTINSYRTEIAALESQRTQLREAIEILSRSETKTVQFGRADVPHGRVFVNRNRGIVFVGSRLPALTGDRTFQLWLIPRQGAPESVGLFRPNAAGDFVDVRTAAVDTTRIQAVAVSVEPPGGSPAPTTKPVLIVPLA